LDKITVRVRRLRGNNDLPLPSYESHGSSGMDIRAFLKEPLLLKPGEIKLVPTGLSVSLPTGYEAQIRPRSGLALNYGIGILNSPRTIDSDYRGAEPFMIRGGDRIAQMVVTRVYMADVVEVEELDETPRGQGGFGHTGIS